MICETPNGGDGGTFTNTTLVNPNIMGGELTNVSLSGKVMLDSATAQELAVQLCPYVSGCVSFDASEVASVFKDCKGAVHQPEAAIPTCEQMTAAINAAVAPSVAVGKPGKAEDTGAHELPVTVVGKSREQLLGEPHEYLQIGGYLIPAYRIA